MNIPNSVTGIRIALIPIFVLLFYLPFKWSHLASAIVFALAGLTDWLDGYLARTLNQTSAFGAFLDPVADKLVVVTALVLLVGEKSIPYLAIPAAIIVGREIVVSALREWMSTIGKKASIRVTQISKIKTAIQMIAIILLLIYIPQMGVTFGLISSGLLYVAAALTLWTMVLYLKVAWQDLKEAHLG